MCELLWSDPQPQAGRSPSKRGVGVGFGAPRSLRTARMRMTTLTSDLAGMAGLRASHDVRSTIAMLTAIHLGLATGPDVTKRFLEQNNLELIVRSHEVRSAGLGRQFC
jgi:hypothetical protein